MQVVSSREFATHHNKYLNMAMDHDIHVKMGQKMFRIIYEPIADEQPVLEPDEDLRNAITFDELRDSVHEHIRKLYAKK